MNIYINNEVFSVQDNISLEQLLEELNIDSKGLAIAFQQEIISKTSWKNFIVQDNQKLTFIRASQGG